MGIYPDEDELCVECKVAMVSSNEYIVHNNAESLTPKKKYEPFCGTQPRV